MNKLKNETKIRLQVISSILSTLFLVAIILFSCARQVIRPKVNPVDYGTDKAIRLIADPVVVDSANNGFRLHYTSKEKITPLRWEQLVTSPQIRDSISRLKLAAPLHFGDMLYTDIYQFAAFASRFHPHPDIILNRVLVFGREKEELYIGPNPNIQNPATWLDPHTQQGILYIGRKEIVYCTYEPLKVYRYLHCYPPNERSETDEHFSHFSEADRLR